MQPYGWGSIRGSWLLWRFLWSMVTCPILSRFSIIHVIHVIHVLPPTWFHLQHFASSAHFPHHRIVIWIVESWSEYDWICEHSIICELWMRISTFSKPICKRLQSKDQWGCDDFLEGHLDLNLFSRDIFHAGDWRLSFCILSIPSGRRVVLWTKMWKGVALSANGWAKRLGRDGIELAFHIYSYHYPLFSFHPDCPSSNMFHSSSFI